MERTLVLVKPDAMQRGLGFEILDRIGRRGLRLVALRLLRVDEGLARRHYAMHEGKAFFQPLIAYITSAPIIAAVFEGTGAIEAVRATVGATNPLQAAPGTIRGDLSLEIGRNLVHASDSREAAEREVALFFTPDQLLDVRRDVDRWVFE